MQTLIHLSDLHFGTDQEYMTHLLLEKIISLAPDVVVVSGDLTQRARISQFKAAKNFLDKIPYCKTICVPGNHDIALYNLVERFLYPFNKYEKFIDPNVCNTYLTDQLAIIGVNSVTPYKPMGGFVTKDQLDKVYQFFHSVSPSVIKIVVMHHNLIKSERHKIINDAEKIINVFGQCNVNLILSGHIHSPHAEQLKRKHFFQNMYVITAGTPISTRTAAPNSFNIIEILEHEFKLTVMQFEEGDFVKANVINFQR